MKKAKKAVLICLIFFTLIDPLYYVNAATENSVNEAESYYNLGLDSEIDDDYIKAQEYYEKAIELDPDNDWYYYSEANALRNQGMYSEALIYLSKAIELNPKSLKDAYYLKGEVLLEMGKYNLSIPYFDRSISKNDNEDSYIAKGAALYNLHRYTEALQNLNKVKVITQNYYNLKGYCLLRLKKYNEALVCFNKELDDNPQYIDSLAGKADSLYELGKYDMAMEVCDIIISKTTSCSGAYYTKGLIYFKKKDIENCVVNLKKAGLLLKKYREEVRLDARFNEYGTSKEFLDLFGCTVKFNGKELMFKVSPIFCGNHAMVPLDELKSCFGYTITVDTKTNSYIIKRNKKMIKFQPSTQYALVDGKKVDIKVKPIYKNNSLLVTASFISDNFGATTKWDSSTKTLYINTQDYSSKNMDSKKEWALATSAVIVLANGWKLNIIGGGIPTMEHKSVVKEVLMDSWDVYDRRSSLETINWLKNTGHRKSYNEGYKIFLSLSSKESDAILKKCENREEDNEEFLFYKAHGKEIGNKGLIAWDYGRLVLVAGMSYTCGYLTYDEAWKEIMDAAEIIQKTYSSWEDMATNYMLGGEYWAGDAYYDKTRINAYHWLLENQNSPWKKLKWLKL